MRTELRRTVLSSRAASGSSLSENSSISARENPSIARSGARRSCATV
jgi:hypothetical protein